MTRVYVIVEGPEESFVKGPLAEALWPHDALLIPIILGVPGHKGGRTNYARVQKDLVRQLKQDRTAYCSTMIDFYGLGRAIRMLRRVSIRFRRLNTLSAPSRRISAGDVPICTPLFA